MSLLYFSRPTGREERVNSPYRYRVRRSRKSYGKGRGPCSAVGKRYRYFQSLAANPGPSGSDSGIQRNDPTVTNASPEKSLDIIKAYTIYGSVYYRLKCIPEVLQYRRIWPRRMLTKLIIL